MKLIVQGTKVQNIRTGVLGFLTSGKGVNIRTDNLRLHMAGSDTCTTSVETTARSKWLEWRSHGCPKVTNTTSNEEKPYLKKNEVYLLSPNFKLASK